MLVFVSAALLTVVAAASGTCPSTDRVRVPVGHDATLRCCFDPPLNLSHQMLDWRKVTKADGGVEVVHAYQNGTDRPDRQNPGFKGRTTLVHEDLSRGVMALRLSDVQPGDAGLYNCSVPRATDSRILLKSVWLDVTNGTEDLPPTTMSPEEDKTTSESPHVAVIAAVCVAVVAICLLAAFVVKVKWAQIQACWRKCGEMRPVEEANAHEMKTLTRPAAADQNHNVELQNHLFPSSHISTEPGLVRPRHQHRASSCCL